MITKRFDGSPAKNDESIDEIFIVDYVKYKVSAVCLGYDKEADETCRTISDGYTLCTVICRNVKKATEKIESLLSNDDVTIVQISKQKLDREKPKIG